MAFFFFLDIISHNSKSLQHVYANQTSMRQEGDYEPQVMATLPQFFTPVSGALKRYQIFFCVFKACVRASKMLSVSWLNSLTETKRLSFFLTPPNSLKCQRSTFSCCWTGETVSKQLLLFLCWAFPFFFFLNWSPGWSCVYFSPHDGSWRVRLSDTVHSTTIFLCHCVSWLSWLLNLKYYNSELQSNSVLEAELQQLEQLHLTEN